jgi:hypothetical protein
VQYELPLFCDAAHSRRRPRRRYLLWEDVWRSDGLGHASGDMVAQLLVQGAEFWVHPDGETIGNPSPAQLGGTAVRLMLIVDDPDAVFDQDGRVHTKLCRKVLPHGLLIER